MQARKATRAGRMFRIKGVDENLVNIVEKIPLQAAKFWQDVTVLSLLGAMYGIRLGVVVAWYQVIVPTG